MSPNRPHSRGGGNARQSAKSGAGQVRPGEGQQQPFAGTGQFTGRSVEQQQPPPQHHQQQPGQPPGQPPPPPQQQQPQQQHQPGAPAHGASQGAPGAPSLEQLAAERDEYRRDLQRVAAEFDNYRKRSVREREQAAAAADAKLLGELLSVLDNFDRALDQGAGAEQSAVVEGISMVRERLLQVLQQHGLHEIETNGTFDPHLHEAVMMHSRDGAQEGDILQVLQKGYMLGDKVLRHSKVIVAGG